MKRIVGFMKEKGMPRMERGFHEMGEEGKGGKNSSMNLRQKT